MKKNLFISLILMALSIFSLNAQDTWKYISSENINFKLPPTWKIINSSKPQGASTIKMYAPDSKQFVEIKCERTNLNTKVRANDIATLRSGQPTFEYMQIDKIQTADFKEYPGHLLNYTNTYLNDVFKGSIYAFVKEGYTYTIEYYGEDNSKTQSFLKEIANNININSADKKDNINAEEKEYTQENWATQEIDNSAEIAAQEAKKAEERAAQEAKKQQEKELKAQQKAQKAVEKEQQKLQKQQEKLEKQQAKLEKEQQKAEKAREKAQKKAEKAEKKRIEKENKIKQLKNRSESISKELNKLANEQLSLGEDYGQAQLKNDQNKMEKIQNKQAKLAKKVAKLNKEQSEITKKLSKF